MGKTPYLGSDVMVLHLQPVVRNWVIQCAAVRLPVQEDLTGEQALIRFLVLKGNKCSGLLYKLRLKQELIKE